MHAFARCPADFICRRDRVRLYVFKRGRYLIHRIVDNSVKFICLVHKRLSQMFFWTSRYLLSYLEAFPGRSPSLED